LSEQTSLTSRYVLIRKTVSFFNGVTRGSGANACGCAPTAVLAGFEAAEAATEPVDMFANGSCCDECDIALSGGSVDMAAEALVSGKSAACALGPLLPLRCAPTRGGSDAEVDVDDEEAAPDLETAPEPARREALVSESKVIDAVIGCGVCESSQIDYLMCAERPSNVDVIEQQKI
jgi:hypothetical protein